MSVCAYTSRVMAGQPIRRARRDAQAVLQGRPGVSAAIWRTWDLQQRLEYIWGCSLEDARELGEIRYADALPMDRMIKMRIFESLVKRFWKEVDRRAESSADALRDAQESWAARAGEEATRNEQQTDESRNQRGNS